MKTNETAIEFDVPFSDTCIELEWDKPTFFYWYRRVDTMPYKLCVAVVTSEKIQLRCPHDNHLVDTFHKGDFYNRKYAIPAPRMREIAQVLPLFIMNDTGKLYVNGDRKGQKVIYKNYLYLSLQESELEYCTQYDFEEHLIVKIQNYHFAQAYAELYLKVKRAGLLEKEVQNG